MSPEELNELKMKDDEAIYILFLYLLEDKTRARPRIDFLKDREFPLTSDS